MIPEEKTPVNTPFPVVSLIAVILSVSFEWPLLAFLYFYSNGNFLIIVAATLLFVAVVFSFFMRVLGSRKKVMILFRDSFLVVMICAIVFEGIVYLLRNTISAADLGGFAIILLILVIISLVLMPSFIRLFFRDLKEVSPRYIVKSYFAAALLGWLMFVASLGLIGLQF